MAKLTRPDVLEVAERATSGDRKATETLKALAKAAGYCGKPGGWIYLQESSTPVAHGWQAFASRVRSGGAELDRIMRATSPAQSARILELEREADPTPTPAQAKALREIAADAKAVRTASARTLDVLRRNQWVEIRKANGHEVWYVTAAGFRAIGRDDVAENLERALERAEAAKANGTLKAPGEVEYRAPEHVYATDREQATRDADADDEYAALPVLPTPADHARAERAQAPAREDTEGMPTDPAVLQVISLVRHGHLIRRDSDGIWRVNGGTYGLISQDRLQVAVRAALGYGVVDILPESHVKCPILVLREDRIAERKAWDRGVRPGTRVTGLTGRITYEVVRIEQGHAKCYPVYPDGADPESVRWLHLETLTPVS